MYQYVFLFFFNDTATTEIFTLSLHDALPIFAKASAAKAPRAGAASTPRPAPELRPGPPPSRIRIEHPSPVVDGGRFPAKDRKSTRLNSSHANISYAVFCLKKKKTQLYCTIRC